MGTDVVPAMLTPGEFVVSKPAVDAVGGNFLEYINNMGGTKSSKGYNKGGDVQYLEKGGKADKRSKYNLDSSVFDQSVQKFSTVIDQLSTIKLGGTLTVDGKITVDVNLNGGEIIAGAKDALGNMAGEKVTAGINAMLKAHFPQIARKTTMTHDGHSIPGQNTTGPGAAP
jgi:hypothetical protein